MGRRLVTLTAALLALATLAAAQTPAPPPRTDQDKPAPFRVSVDVVAVDVQVIDRNGHPVPDLGPEKFSVTINGKRRRVLTAERVGTDEGENAVTTSSGASSYLKGRVIVLAVDCGSFDATASRGVIQAARQFIGKLAPDDYVGLSAYPNGPKVDPTTDHGVVVRALETVVGQRDLAERTQFKVRPRKCRHHARLRPEAGGPVFDSVVARENAAIHPIPSAVSASSPTSAALPSTSKERGP